MIRLTAAFSLMVAFVGTAVGVAATPATRPLTARDLAPFFDGLIPYAIQRGDIAGAGLVVVRDGKIIFAKGYGFADVVKRTRVIPDRTLFRPGSVSKLFTWTAVMQQVQAGKLNLDADVNTYLDFKIPEKFGKPITLRNLMTHTAGFEETARDLLVERRTQLYPIREYLIKRMPNRIYPPGKIIAYSNYGATLAGYIVQRVSGEEFSAYVAKHILTPLKMNHSTFAQPLPPRLSPLMASGYDVASSEKPADFEFVETAPAGALSSTVTDMAHFMLAYLDNGREAGGTILSPATIREMFTLQVPPAPGMNGYDLGFYQENRNGQMIVGHGGDTNVFHSDLHLLPQQRVGIFMAFNSAGKAGAVEDVRTQIFRHFLDRYYPYAPPAQPTVGSAKRDAGRVTGWYQSSRRIERALRFIYALGQTSVTARPDNTIEVSMLTGPADTALRWREVGPLYYRQVNGQAHLKFTADPDGRVVSWTTDEIAPVFIFQRVNGLQALGAIKPLLTCFIVVLIVSLLIRLGAWIARRRLHLRLDLPPAERWIHLAARIGALAFLLALAAWTAVLSNDNAILQSSFVTELTLLYVIGLIAILGGLAMIAETVLRVAHGPGGWLVRFGEVIVGLAAVYGIWFFMVFGLANFVTNF